ncbi:MAG: T9SS type A sorting domain-containing protein [Ignavibacteria bacterium]|nr:T9SS type A sorting domain-containing protein [Ignavibacteria bacterium]
MRKTILIVCIFVSLILLSQRAEAQSPSEISCGSSLFQLSQLPVNPVNGYYKPDRTDTINGNPLISAAYFPVLIVFVQFLDDASYDIWPNTCDTSGPIYRDSLIASIKNNNSNWWNAYDQSKETFSNYYLQLSLGRFHVLGKAYSVRLNYDSSHYQYSGGVAEMNIEIWNKLSQRYSVDWSYFDKWSWNGTNFEYAPDNNIDFIYKIHKTTSGVLLDYSGYNTLEGNDFQVDTVRWIRTNSGYTGSGITCARNLKKDAIMGICVHEHGHFTFSGGHLIYGHNSYGLGPDAFYSPYEMIACGYMTPMTATFGQTNNLGDYSSHSNRDGEVLKVPISETEFFLLANRTKVCYWDRVMMGDTAMINPYNTTEYGKGLYIYHVFNGITRPTLDYCSPQDMECADGYYRWERVDWASVDMNCWTSEPVWRTFRKAEVLYDNDASPLGTNILKGDGLSLHDYFGNNPNGSPRGYTIKHGYGAAPVDNCHFGTNRLYTNSEDLYTTFDSDGDRWDAWKPGYNEVFSPYSSPSTAKYNNDTSGVFIYYDSSNGNTADIKIYRVGNGGYNLSSILQATPPSRPMGLNIYKTLCEKDRRYPLITWNHNMEPDMLQGINSAYKRYKIFRAISDINNVPGDFLEIADTLINKDDSPAYIDYSTYGNCKEGSSSTNDYRLRYKIKAVDNTNWASVYSDFVSIVTRYLNRNSDDDGDNMLPIANAPKTYKLSQNYPNPFNPSTTIAYSLPKDSKVSLKIYDITGREVKSLVNDIKPAGYYSISFNGSELSSGVYFYKIEAGNFVQVKRMVLIK